MRRNRSDIDLPLYVQQLSVNRKTDDPLTTVFWIIYISCILFTKAIKYKILLLMSQTGHFKVHKQTVVLSLSCFPCRMHQIVHSVQQ